MRNLKLKNIFKKMNGTQESEINQQETQNMEQKPHVEVQPIDEKENKLIELQAKVDELNEKYIRLYSEFDNFRKRTAKEKIDLMKAAGEDFYVSLLPVIDDFDRAIKSNSEITDVNTIKDGVNLIYNKFKNTLTQKGLEEMKSLSEPFDTDLHEAITNAPSPSEDMKGKIIEELEKGYFLNGKVIRFAKVVIGS